MQNLRAAFRAYLYGGSDAPEVIFSNLPELETPHLLLRMLKRSDARDIFEYARDPEVARHVLWDAHRSIEDSREYIRYVRRLYKEGLPSVYGICLKDTGKLIGTIAFVWYSPENRSAEIGYSLGKAWWGKGYATEALRAVLELGFDRLKLHRAEAMHETDNPASGRVMEKCGMRPEGVLRGRVYNKDHFSDVRLYALLEEDRK